MVYHTGGYCQANHARCTILAMAAPTLTDVIDKVASAASTEIIAKAQAHLAFYNLPYTESDGAFAAACAMAGATFVNSLAHAALHEVELDPNAGPCGVYDCAESRRHRHLLPLSTGAAVKAIADRAMEAFAAIVSQHADRPADGSDG